MGVLFDGADRASEQTSDFVFGAVSEETKSHDFTLASRQLRQSVRQVQPFLAAIVVRRIHSNAIGARSAGSPNDIEGEVRRNAHHPGLGVATHARPADIGACHGFLRDVLGLGPLAEQAKGGAISNAVTVIEGLLER